jgi:DNA (cytosine-5)-methyltransferase 1
VCSNFSKAKINRKEHSADLQSAIATAQAISNLQPGTFTLENVAEYRDSESWYYLEQTLKVEGYKLIDGLLDAADFGVPQTRKRFYVLASLNEIPSFPAVSNWVGWYEAIADLIPNLPTSKLLRSKKSALENQLRRFPQLKALLIQHTGGEQVKNPDEPCWTITRSVFTDQKGNNRRKFADVWLPDGTVKALTLEASARLQSFPSWYVFPESMSVAGSIVGYSVPPLMMQKLLQY